MNVYRVDGLATAGHAAPWSFLTIIPGTGNIIRIVRCRSAARARIPSVLYRRQLLTISADITGSARFTPVPVDQYTNKASTATAKNTTTVDSGSASKVLDVFDFQLVTNKDVHYYIEAEQPKVSGSTVLALRKTSGADTFVWGASVYFAEGWVGREEIDEQQFRPVGPIPITEDGDAELYALLAPANIRVRNVGVEAWVSNPNLRARTLGVEAWTTPTVVNMRIANSAVEAWVTNTGNFRVKNLGVEAWIPSGLIAALSLSFGATPQLKLDSNRVNRSLSPFMSAPLLDLGETNIAVFPNLPGIAWPVIRELLFAVEEQLLASGKQQMVTEWTDPVWQYTLHFEFLRAGSSFLEEQMLLGLFCQSLGKYGLFLFDDPDDDVATNVVFADATTLLCSPTQTKFQLVRNFYDNTGNVLATAPVYAPKASGLQVRVEPPLTALAVRLLRTGITNQHGAIIFDTSPVINVPPGSHNFIAVVGRVLPAM